MIVPNFIPEPLEVPGNVTLLSYRARLAFIRGVVSRHVLTLCLVAGLSYLPWPGLGWERTLMVYVGLVVLLDLVRISSRGQKVEPKVATAALPVVLGVAAWLVNQLSETGFPVWALGVGPLCLGIYTAACGRDFSFTGGFVLSLLASSVITAAIVRGSGTGSGALALGTNAAWLLYHVYDLASLMARRRADELWAAVLDLYRDMFNFFGYLVRCVAYWRKTRIFNP